MSVVTEPIGQASRRGGARPGGHHQRIDRLGVQEHQRRCILSTCVVFSVAVLLLGAIAGLDSALELSLGLRCWFLAGVVTVLVAIGYRLKKWTAFDSVDAVCRTEQRWPELGQRLRTSHDYLLNPEGVSPADPGLLDALESETQEQVLERPLKPLGPSWPIAALASVLFLAVGVWSLSLLFAPEWRIATARLWLLPVHYSQVSLDPLPERVELGDDLQVQLQVRGRPIASAELRYRGVGETAWNRRPLKPESGTLLVGSLAAVVPDCQRDLEVEILAEPMRETSHRIAVILPLRVEKWVAKVQPPAYTGLPVTEGDVDDMRIPAGSQVSLSAEYNRPPERVDVEFSPAISQRPKVHRNERRAELTLKAGEEPMEVMVHAVTADGVEDHSVTLLTVVPDQVPTLRFASPENDTEAIPTAELHFTLEAFDDYGLDSVSIRYRIDDGPEQVLWQSEPGDVLLAEHAQSVTLPLEDLQLAYPQAITYFAVATDKRGSDAGRAATDLRFIDIRPFSRQYEFQAGQCNCQGECLSLETLINEQRQILGETFSANQASGPPADSLAGKLASQEQDVHEKTLQLSAALQQKIGPMPMLDDAASWMSNAVDELQAKSLSPAQRAEEKALSRLVAARRNLRQILKQGSSASQMARSVDRKQQDKIRKPPQKDQPPRTEQQLAELRDQLEKLAAKQQRFCQSARQCQSDGASSPSSSQASGQQPSSQQPTEKPSSGEQQVGSSAERESPESLAQQQRESEAEARKIADQLRSGSFGELASQRVGEAADSIRKSAESLADQGASDAEPRRGDPEFDDAIASAERAEELLRKLSEHLGQRHHPDFEDKLAAARRKAEQIAAEQDAVNDSLMEKSQAKSPAEDHKPEALAKRQTRLAERTEELEDLAGRLIGEASQQSERFGHESAERLATGPLQRAKDQMRRAASEVQSNRYPSAAQEGRRAAETLRRFASGIKSLQEALGPIQLEQLTAAERRVAEAIKALDRARGNAEAAMAAAQAVAAANALDALTRSDPELNKAANQIPRFSQTPTRLVEGLRGLDSLLQRRIQEEILKGAMQQSNGPVPPPYTEMVEEYFRKLSDDVE